MLEHLRKIFLEELKYEGRISRAKPHPPIDPSTSNSPNPNSSYITFRFGETVRVARVFARSRIEFHPPTGRPFYTRINFFLSFLFPPDKRISITPFRKGYIFFPPLRLLSPSLSFLLEKKALHGMEYYINDLSPPPLKRSALKNSARLINLSRRVYFSFFSFG